MNQPVRPQIWVLTSEFAPHIIGGLGTSATNLSNAMAGKGLNVTVLSRNTRPTFKTERKNGIRIIRFPKSKAYKHAKKMGLWLSKHAAGKPRYLHVHSISFVDLAEQLRKKHNAPIIYTCHSLVAAEIGPRWKIRRALRQQVKLLRIANRVVVPSRSERRKLARLYPFAAKKTVVIKHGVRMPRGSAHGPSHHLLYVGRLVPVKGIKQLLQAFAIISRRKKDARLFIIGKGPNGYTKYLKSIAKKHGIRKKVRFLGFRRQAQLQRMYASYGAVIVPSHQESFGLVALEALSSGVPLVSTRSGGLSEIVNKRVAQVIPRVDQHAIARAILQMWRDRSATKRRVIAGRNKAKQHSWPRAAAQYKQLFRRVRRK